MAMSVEKIIGAIQWTCGGPKLVQAKPNRPIVSSGAANALQRLMNGELPRSTYYRAANTGEPQAEEHLDPFFGLDSPCGSRE